MVLRKQTKWWYIVAVHHHLSLKIICLMEHSLQANSQHMLLA